MNKYFLLIVTLTGFLTSCGVVEEICPRNAIESGCNALVGMEPKDGDNGEDGEDGQSCFVNETDEGADITCGGNTVSILDGDDAVSSPYTVTEIVDPCGDDPGSVDEVLLKIYNGDYVSYFEDAGRRFLTVLSPGSYRTTDSQSCRFSIDGDGNFEEL